MAAARPLTRPSAAPASRWRPSLRFPLLFALGLGAVSLAPYVIAYLWTPPGHHFMGFFFIADDATTYIAKMRQGAAGAWTWNDPYTSEPHQSVFLYGFYLLFGHVAGWLHLPLIAAYHLARVSGAVALVVSIDLLARRLLAPQLRRLAVVLAVLGSGLGFIAQAAGNPTVFGQQIEALDLHLPELSGWYSILAIPHFAWATALIVLTLLGLLSLLEAPGVRACILTGLALVALTAIHPQMMPVLALVWIAYLVVLAIWGRRPSWRAMLAQAAVFGPALPLLAYNAWVLYRDPTIAEWARQWRHQAPNSPSLALSLGIPLLAAAYGMVITWRRRDTRQALLMVWPPMVIALLYLPNAANIQRRLIDAVYVPLGLLAAVGIREALAHLSRSRARRLERLLVPACCLSSGVVLAIALRFAFGAFPEAYLADDQWRALGWLSAHHTTADRAVSSPGIGLDLPAWSGVSVYVGHYSETLDYFAKIGTVDAVLQASSSPATVESFLRANGITLVYWGPEEQALTYQPDGQPYLRRIYSSGSVAIYRVVLGP